MITLTIVRHGESTDNLKPCWAGWSDAPLSNHGMNQAKALGTSMISTKFDSIVASDLIRARWTAEQIEKNQSEPKPPMSVSPLLRERNFGIAEHKPFGEKGYIRRSGRQFKFDEGESLEDVRRRAHTVISEHIEPALRECQGQSPQAKHIAVVAHGIFNAEFIGALLARTREGGIEWGYRGMTNTGWTRLEVGYLNESPNPPAPSVVTSPTGPIPLSSQPAAPPAPQPIDQDLPPLSVRVLCTDVTKHLDGIHRQKGGIGSQGYDEKQKDLRAFFSGAQTPTKE